MILSFPVRRVVKHVTADQVADMVTKAVAKAVEPVLKSRGLPNNLNDTGVEKNAGEHYLHGILHPPFFLCLCYCLPGQSFPAHPSYLQIPLRMCRDCRKYPVSSWRKP